MKTAIWAVSIVCLIFASNAFAVLSGGGTQANPYLIQSRADFDTFANPANAATYWASGKYTKLICDVNLAGSTYTQAVIAPDTNSVILDFQGARFNGVFDGNGRVISNLTITASTKDYIGLFGCIGSGGQIKNLGVGDVNVTGYYHVGGLCGNTKGTINGCYATGVVKGYTFVGGLCGYNDHVTISDCYATAAVTGNGNFVGGLCGNNYYGTISGCYVTGAITGSGAYVGGLCGYNDHFTITNCYATGAVNGSDESIGGLCGDNHGTISHCCATGAVTGTGDAFYVGGLCGNSSGTISDCYATGVVTGFYNVGGLCGTGGGTISGCYATGAVTVTENSYYAGGLCGHGGGTISDCYATGTVNGSNYAGGLCGLSSSGMISNCYATGAVTGRDGVGGLCGVTDSVTISGCYSTGAVTGSHDYVGGLCGYNYLGTLSNCYATGVVTEAGNRYFVGGLCGDNYGTISDCYAAGAVQGNGIYVGGFCGRNGSTISGCFWDMQTTDKTVGVGNGSSTGVTGEMTTQMKMRSTFVSAPALWDFVGEVDNGTADVWRMCVDGISYPRLAWEFSGHGDFVCPDGVRFEDFAVLAKAWLSSSGDAGWNAACDIAVPTDGKIDTLDLMAFAQHWLE